jgi:hypothetical protein
MLEGAPREGSPRRAPAAMESSLRLFGKGEATWPRSGAAGGGGTGEAWLRGEDRADPAGRGGILA